MMKPMIVVQVVGGNVETMIYPHDLAAEVVLVDFDNLNEEVDGKIIDQKIKETLRLPSSDYRDLLVTSLIEIRQRMAVPR